MIKITMEQKYIMADVKIFPRLSFFSVLTRILIPRFDVHVFLGISGFSDLVLVDNKPSYMYLSHISFPTNVHPYRKGSIVLDLSKKK